MCNSFIFSRRRRTRVVRCWSIRSPETATAVCRGYIGIGASSIPLEETSTSSGETWFQPRFVDWNGGTDSRCFRMRLCEVEDGVTIERLSEIWCRCLQNLLSEFLSGLSLDGSDCLLSPLRHFIVDSTNGTVDCQTHLVDL